MGTFTGIAMQYVRPNGRKRVCHFELPCSVEKEYDDMIIKGFRIETEILLNGIVSLTIGDEDGDVDIELTDNGPKVIETLCEMLKRKRWDCE